MRGVGVSWINRGEDGAEGEYSFMFFFLCYASILICNSVLIINSYISTSGFQ